jgi:hypothetical protein
VLLISKLNKGAFFFLLHPQYLILLLLLLALILFLGFSPLLVELLLFLKPLILETLD